MFCVRPAGEVRMPSGRTACPNITDNKDGTVTVKYSPTERGLHEMDIKYDGNHIPGNSQHASLHQASEEELKPHVLLV